MAHGRVEANAGAPIADDADADIGTDEDAGGKERRPMRGNGAPAFVFSPLFLRFRALFVRVLDALTR